MTTTETVAAQVRIAPNQATFSVEDALALRDLQARACSVERLLYAWPKSSDNGIGEPPVLRPTRRYEICLPDDYKATGCGDDDARLLQRQLHSPHDHGAELLRSLRRALAGRIGHLSSCQQRLVLIPPAAWPGAHMPSLQEAVAVAVRLKRHELGVADMRLAVKNALLIVRLAQEHVATRLAIIHGQPLPLAKSIRDLKGDPADPDWPDWWTFDAPGPHDAPWDLGTGAPTNAPR